MVWPCVNIEQMVASRGLHLQCNMCIIHRSLAGNSDPQDVGNWRRYHMYSVKRRSFPIAQKPKIEFIKDVINLK